MLLHTCKFFVFYFIRLKMEMLKERIREITLVQINYRCQFTMRLRKPLTSKMGIFRPNHLICL